MECLNDLIVGSPRPAGSFVGQEQNPRMGQLAGGGFADRGQALQAPSAPQPSG